MKRARVHLGLACLLSGLGLLAWFGWQLYGTTWVSHRAQREVVDALEQRWVDGADEVETGHGTSRAVVRVPRFGADYRVPVLEGTSDDALAAGVGHVDGTAPAGAAGNYVLAGHRVTHGEPFRDLPELVPGDQVVVETRGAVFTYELTTGGDDLEVPFTAGWVLDPHPVNPDAGGPAPTGDDHLLTLTTCAELFHTDERLVVFGRLVSETRR